MGFWSSTTKEMSESEQTSQENSENTTMVDDDEVKPSDTKIEQNTPAQTFDQSSQLEQQQPKKKLPSIFSSHLKTERKILFKSILRLEIILVAIVLGILSLYWGGLASLVPNERVLTIAIVDFDGQEVGNAFTQFGIY
jgi:hypothetical protein